MSIVLPRNAYRNCPVCNHYLQRRSAALAPALALRAFIRGVSGDVVAQLEDCYFRMMREHEIGRGCGFDVDFADHKGTFTVWGSARDQVDGFGNAVSPPVGTWICRRLRTAYHGEVAA